MLTKKSVHLDPTIIENDMKIEYRVKTEVYNVKGIPEH